MTDRASLRRWVLTAAAAAVATSVGAQEAGDRGALRSAALELVNASRAEAGLPDLGLDETLTEAAQGHASDMLEEDYYAHVSPDGETPLDRFRAAGGSTWAVSGENIATCSGCAAPADAARIRSFHDGWMQSPEHRENILSPGFDGFGFGIAGEGDEIYAVQTFAGPGGSGAEAGIGDDAARAAALEAVNARRAEAGLAALEPSADLDAVASHVVEARLRDEPLPENLFGLLPDGSAGWTSLALRSASRGGSGPELTPGAVEAFVETWASSAGDSVLGGARATHLGFAAAAEGSGRATAVMVLGGRG